MQKEQSFDIDNEAQIFVVAPYWTSIASIGMPPAARPKLLRQLTENLNERDNEGADVWKIEQFHVPRTLKFRRYGQIWRQFNLRDDLLDKLKQYLGVDHFGGYFSRLTYFDYGIGCVEVSICCSGIDKIGIEEFSRRAERVKLAMVEAFNGGLIEADLDLEAIDGWISEFLKKHLSGLPNKLRPSYDASILNARAALFCGPVSRNIIFTDSKNFTPKIPVSSGDISRAAFNYINEAEDNGGYTGSEKIPISHEGFEGAVALVRRGPEASVRVCEEIGTKTAFSERIVAEIGEVQRTKLLWSLVHTYWSALFCASEGFFSIAASYGNDDHPSLRQIERELSEIDEYQKIVSMIKFESKPEKIIVEGEDRSRYAKVWKAYDSEELLRSLDQILQDSSATLESLRNRAQKIIQVRTTRIFTAFTLLTLLSVIADMIILFDVSGQTDAEMRLMLLISGGLGLSLVAIAAWIIGVKFASNRRKRS